MPRAEEKSRLLSQVVSSFHPRKMKVEIIAILLTLFARLAEPGNVASFELYALDKSLPWLAVSL